MGVLKIYQTPKACSAERVLAKICVAGIRFLSDLLKTIFSTLYSNTYRQLVYKRFHPEPVGPQNYS